MFQEPEESRIPEDKIRELTDKLENEARKIGLYLAGVAVSLDLPDEDHPSSGVYVVQATFSVGSVAFSTRVQNPEQDGVEDEVRAMEQDFTQQEWNALREEYRRRRAEGPEEEL